MALAAIGFLALDHSNISQANTSTFLKDFKLTTDDFDLENSIFHLAFLCAEFSLWYLTPNLTGFWRAFPV